MSNPTPHPPAAALHAGPLIFQPASAARLAHILCHAAEDLWEASTLDDPAQMYEEARAAASRVLSCCPLE